MIVEQAQDDYCKAPSLHVSHLNSEFHTDQRGLLVRKPVVDESIQIVVLKSLRMRILYLTHYPPIAGHPGTRRMYDTHRQKIYWPHMANELYTTVAQCVSCVKNRNRLRHKRRLQLFMAVGPLDVVAMDILGPLLKTQQGNQYIVMITDKYSKLTRAIPNSKILSTHMSNIFLDHWIIPFGIPSYLLTDNGPQIVRKLFATVCGSLVVKHVTTTAYHPQTNCQAKRFNRTIVTRLRLYVTDHQRDCNLYTQPLTYA